MDSDTIIKEVLPIEMNQLRLLKMFGKKKLIDEYKLGENVTQLLKVYFEKWLNKRGRFADADELHGYVVRAKIGELVSFHLSDDDMITCIQNSIDKETLRKVPNKTTI